jgi:2-dehydro-3-deoxygluconokinase
MKAADGFVSFDAGLKPSKLVKEKVLEVAARVNIFLVNRDEAVVLTGEQNPEKAFEALEATGAKEVVVKLGSQGCLIRAEGKIYEVPAIPVKAVNATGAGDAFTALYLWARVQQWPPREAALLANAAGAAATSVEGAAESMPVPDTVFHLLGEAALNDEWKAIRNRVLPRAQTALETVVGH